MNNAARGVIFAFGLAGMGLMFVAMLDGLDTGGSGAEFTMKDLAEALTGGLGMVACAIIAGAALAGMTPSPPKPITFPGQPGAVPAQGQPYPYQAAPQLYAQPQQQYGQQNPQPGSQ